MDHWRPRSPVICSICLSVVLLLSLMSEEKEHLVQAHGGVGKHLYRLLKKSRFIPIPIIIPVHHSHHSEHHHHHHGHKKHHKHDHGSRWKRQLMPGPAFLPFAGPMQGSASMSGGVHTIPSLQHHQKSHQNNFPLQMHHYGSPYIPFPGVGLGHDPGKAFAMLSNKRLMFLAILKATVKLYLELGVLISMAMGTLWMIFGSAFTRVVQMGLHAVGNTFLSLGSTIHNSHVKQSVR